MDMPLDHREQLVPPSLVPAQSFEGSDRGQILRIDRQNLFDAGVGVGQILELALPD